MTNLENVLLSYLIHSATSVDWNAIQDCLQENKMEPIVPYVVYYGAWYREYIKDVPEDDLGIFKASHKKVFNTWLEAKTFMNTLAIVNTLDQGYMYYTYGICMNEFLTVTRAYRNSP
jgi:hypothetical protein